MDAIFHKYCSKLNLTFALMLLHQLANPSHDHLVHQSNFLDLTILVVSHPLPFPCIPSLFHQRRMHHLNQLGTDD